jgi:hypothetical protein
MGKTPVNTALGEVRGKIDDWVFRRLEGETIVARKRRPQPDNPTANQVKVRERFREASDYAKDVYDDPIRKESYRLLAESRGVSAARLFSFIVGDYARPPEITRFNLTLYTRTVGSEIRVYATDDGEVTDVTVRLKRPDGSLIEEGGAVKSGAYWRYEASTDVPAGVAVTVEATAEDRAENLTTKAEVVP